jgi:periplasmic divalent cation tolerance protein
MNANANAAHSISIFYITCPDSVVGEKISTILLENKLIACANLIPMMTSLYWWNDKIEKSSEVLLLLKTNPIFKKQIEEKLNEIHPYQVFCLLEIPTASINDKYLNWLVSNLKA